MNRFIAFIDNMSPQAFRRLHLTLAGITLLLLVGPCLLIGV